MKQQGPKYLQNLKNVAPFLEKKNSVKMLQTFFFSLVDHRFEYTHPVASAFCYYVSLLSLAFFPYSSPCRS